MEAYLYILGASPNPDRVECSVPYRVDDKEIFFGPCMKKLRSKLARRFLRDSGDAAPGEPIYLVGFNGMNADRIRKIVWVGRIKRVMTFARAWDELKGPRYEAMRGDPSTPVHLQPIYENHCLVGYQHVGQLHGDEGWIEDLDRPADPRSPRRFSVSQDRRTVRVHDGISARDAFPRDACFLMENLFSAGTGGMEINDEILAMLKEAQPGRDVTPLAIFGLNKNRDPEGRQGSYLRLEEPLASRFIAPVVRRSSELAMTNQVSMLVPSPRRGCGCGSTECEEESTTGWTIEDFQPQP